MTEEINYLNTLKMKIVSMPEEINYVNTTLKMQKFNPSYFKYVILLR